MARLLVAVCLLAVAAATGARADGAVFDGALGGGDDTAGVRVLLEVDAQRQRDAQFAQHVAALVSGLHAHAQADTRAIVIDESDAADAEAEADAAEELNAAAAIAETAAGEELEAEGLADAPVFGEAAEAEAEVFEAVAALERAEDMTEFSAGPALLEADAQAQADAEADADSDAAEAAAHAAAAAAADAEAAEAAAEAEAEGEVFGEAAPEETEIVEAIPSEQSLADEREWSAGPAFVEVDADDAEEDVAEAEADADADAEDEEEDESEAEADAEEEEEEADAEDAEDAALVQVQARVRGDWKDPPVWWKAPEEEMANADQQPWPLDPNFPMSVLDPPPNLPLANIEDANNYPPMADPNLAFNIDPSAFPQTNPRVGSDDPSFASFSINGR